MRQKCVITEIGTDCNICYTMEEAEKLFEVNRLTKILKELDSYYCGYLVDENFPLGYFE